MNKDQVKGTVDDVAGRTRRQVGEWTNDPNAQAEGLGQQVKGKAEKAWGAMKDAAQSGHDHAKHEAARTDVESGSAWERTKEAAHDAKEDVKDAAQKAWDSTKDAVNHGKNEVERRHEAAKYDEPVVDEDPRTGNYERVTR